MALEMTILDDLSIPDHWPVLMEELWLLFCAQENVPLEAIVDLTLCGEETIQEVNRDYRDIDAPTDVLSFPMFEPDEPIASMAGEDLLLGDILISMPHILRQADSYGHSIEREALYLLAHGLLHLVGYDHLEQEDQALMRQQEEALMADLGIEREAQLSRESLSALAQKAAENAYAPHSDFPVGAALLGINGKVYLGCNVENASYGLTSCAERNAVFAAIVDGCRDFEALAIAGGQDAPVMPCGACRQVLAEFAPTLEIHTTNLKGSEHSTTNLGELFPQAFQLKTEEEEA